ESRVTFLFTGVPIEVTRVVELGRIDEQGDDQGVAPFPHQLHQLEMALMEEAEGRDQPDRTPVCTAGVGECSGHFHFFRSSSRPARIAVASAKRLNCRPTGSDTSCAAV